MVILVERTAASEALRSLAWMREVTPTRRLKPRRMFTRKFWW
jgi:vacuolar-type H+-ATPase subunit B/Vma2